MEWLHGRCTTYPSHYMMQQGTMHDGCVMFI
jgi:hypothetical protein